MLDYRILGPLEVGDGDRTVALGGIRARAVLAVLAVSANRSVSTAVLIDEVWGGRAPATAANVVQGHVSDLRRVLGRDAVQTRDEGYRLVILHGGRDLDRFEQLAAEVPRPWPPARPSGRPSPSRARLPCGAARRWPRSPPRARWSPRRCAWTSCA